jgi:hypothetical protein
MDRANELPERGRHTTLELLEGGLGHQCSRDAEGARLESAVNRQLLAPNALRETLCNDA